jgi:FAD/FMN-containing dehydrogenase
MLGASTAGSVLIDLCRMDEVALDPSTNVIRAGGGARSGALFAAGRPHGVVPMLGMSPNVGIGGLALGGGIGWLSGAHGATVDHVLAVEVVTADGQHLKADARENPDLFWALRGGGGNFGVATAFTLRTLPLTSVLAGTLRFKAEPRALLRFLREFLAASADTLDIALSITLGSDPTVAIRLCWSGDAAAGDRALRPLRRFAATTGDSVSVRPLADFVDDEPQVDGLFLRGGEFDGLTDAVIEALAAVVDEDGPKDCEIGLLHYMHGVLCRAAADDTPFVRPCGHVLYNIVAPWRAGARENENVAWALATAQTLKAVSSARTYVNYLCEEDEATVRRTYGPHYDRLRALKRAYDPDNVFRNTRNIRS